MKVGNLIALAESENEGNAPAGDIGRTFPCGAQNIDYGNVQSNEPQRVRSTSAQRSSQSSEHRSSSTGWDSNADAGTDTDQNVD